MQQIKKALTVLVMAGLLGLISCDTIDDSFDLDLSDPNNPTPEVLNSEEGIKRLASGFMNRLTSPIRRTLSGSSRATMSLWAMPL